MNDTMSMLSSSSEPPPDSMEPAERLQRLWERGLQPDLDLFLAETGSLTPEQLVVILRVDQRRRWQQATPIRAEAYLEKYAFLRNDAERMVDLIYSEYLLREAAGEGPVVEEYVLRFPEYANDLRTQIGLHGAMGTWSITGLAPSSSENSSSEATNLADRETSPGRREPSIPGFEILDFIGQGGMGVVYKARQLHLKRTVALKMLLAGEYAGREQLTRFRTEAEAAARLHHPNIVEIYEVGDVEARPFLVLEYVAGGNLKQNLGTTLPPARSAAQLVETLARAMHYAHQQGVVHRDLKPANVLLQIADCGLPMEKTGTFGQCAFSDLQSAIPKITDFGLAKQLTASIAPDQTQSGAILGTPSYMAPEQAAGNARQVGPAADIYALGAVLYELLTGRPPFLGDTPLQTLQRVACDEPVIPSRLLAGLPYDLETICLKCLEKNPQKRYPTALALAEDLGRFLADEPIRARPVGNAERFWRWCKRNPGWAAAVALLFIIAAGASVLSLQLFAALGRTQEAEVEVESKLYQSRIAEARAKSLSRRSGQRFESLALLDLAKNQLAGRDLLPQKLMELRNATLSALVMPDIYPAHVWAGFPPGSFQVDFNDGLDVYSRTDNAGTCSIRRVVDDHEMYSFSCGMGSPILSRDGRFVAIQASDGRVRLWRLNETAAQLLLTETTVVSTDFHPNCALVAFSHSNGSLTLHELDSARKIPPLPPDTLTREVVIALHPSKPWVAVASYHAKVMQVRDWSTGAIIGTMEMPGGCSDVAWHPQGLFLAASDGDGPNLHVFDGVTFQPQKKLGPIWGGSHIYFNHSGDRLAVVGWDVSIRLFDFGTEQLLVQLPYTASTAHLRFSADDRRLAGFIREGELGIWNLADGREYRSLTHHAGPQSEDSAAVSPDGRLLAVTLTDGIGLWDLAAGPRLAFVPMKRPSFVQFDCQGALITREQSGVYLWPIHTDSPRPGHLRFGPPSPLSLPPGGQLSQSRDGRVLAVRARATGSEEAFAGVWILDRENHENLMHLAAGTDIWQIAVSPDGAWLVTADNHNAVTVWEARTGRLKQTLLERGGGRPCFSPDGRWLAIEGANGGLFNTESWERKRKLGSSVHFAPDSRMMVVRTGTHVLRLEDTSTGEELARLEDPNLDVAQDLVFTPDGTRLVVLTAGRSVLHVWDVRLLRGQLAERGLDWAAPPYPQALSPAEPLAFHIDQGGFDQLRPRQMWSNYDRAVQMAPHLAGRRYVRGIFHRDAGRIELAIADLKEVIKRVERFEERGFKARCCNDLARLYATAPEKLRKKEDAVALAERAVKLQGGQWDYQNTLGIAYYRAGRFQDAVRALQAGLQSGRGESDAFDLYFLALCHHQLGDAAKARAALAQGRTWHEQNRSRLSREEKEELQRFREEAEKALGSVSRIQPGSP